MGSKAKKKLKAVVPYQPTPTNEGYLLWKRELITPNSRQPRKYFDPIKITALKDSIQAIGIQEPLRILPLDVEGHAKLVDGERRFRAATELGLEMIPVFLSSLQKSDERGLFRESLIANLCREEMTEIEMAKGLQHLIDLYSYTQEEVAKLMGKTSGWVSNMLKYLKLHPEVADELGQRKISPAMALAVSRFPQEDQPMLASHLQQAKKNKGGALTSEEIAREVADVARGKKIKPLKPKKGKQPEMNPEKLLVKSVTRRLVNIKPDVETLLAISSKKLEAAGGEPLLLLEQEVKVLRKSFETLLGRLSEAL